MVIVLVYVLWKKVAVVLDLRLVAAIMIHGILCRFWAGRRMGTASLEAKPIQQLTDMMG